MDALPTTPAPAVWARPRLDPLPQAATLARVAPYAGADDHAIPQPSTVSSARVARATPGLADASGTMMAPRAQAAAVDELMVVRARRGDLTALETLYRTLEAPVFNLARRLVRNPADAEEVLQETFLEVVRSLPRFRGEGSFEGWVKRIAASKALMRLRSLGRRRETPLEPGDAEGWPEVVRVEHDPVHHRLDLEGALARLGEVPRAVVWLHDVEGYTHDEIAALCGRTASFSKSQLARAHARLRVWLGGEEETAPCTRIS